MELVDLIRLGTPALILGMIVCLERIRVKVDIIRDQVTEIRKSMINSETCHAKHDDINRRLDNIEQRL